VYLFIPETVEHGTKIMSLTPREYMNWPNVHLECNASHFR